MKFLNSNLLFTGIAAGATFASLAKAGFYNDQDADAGGTIATAATPQGMTAQSTSYFTLNLSNKYDVDFIKVHIPDPTHCGLLFLNGPVSTQITMYSMDGTGIHGSRYFNSAQLWIDTDAIHALPAGDYVLAVSAGGWNPKTQSGQDIFKFSSWASWEYVPQTTDPLDHFDGSPPDLGGTRPVLFQMGGVESIVPNPTTSVSMAVVGGLLVRGRRR